MKIERKKLKFLLIISLPKELNLSNLYLWLKLRVDEGRKGKGKFTAHEKPRKRTQQ